MNLRRSVPSNNTNGASETAPARATLLAGLVMQIAQCNEDALARLYDETHRLVYSLIYRVVGESGVAEEVTLDVYWQVWRQAGRYDAQRGAILTWLLTIARSRAIDRLRASRTVQQQTDQLDMLAVGPPPDGEAEGLDEAAFAAERRQNVRQALRALPPEQCEVIELAYFWGFSQSEIALRLSVPLGTVKTRVRLGLMKLRELIDPLWVEDW